mgnify:CR=1 FL=1
MISMYKVKIFFGSFYGEWFENDFLEDMDWSDISVAECMIEAHFPVVPAHGSIVDVSSLRSQIYKGWKKYVDAGGYLSDVIDGVRCKFKIPRQIPNADIFKEMVFGGNYYKILSLIKIIGSVLMKMKMSFMEYV